MLSFIAQPATTHNDEQEWQEELTLWGVSQDVPEPAPDEIALWPENWDVMMWWLSIPSFLKWNMGYCMGMDVLAVQADAQMSGRDIKSDDYQKLKLIARVVTEELNGRKQ